MSFTRYTQVVLAVVGSSLVLSWPLAGVAGGTAVAAGAALAALNALAAYRLVVWAEGQPTVAFFRAILGGMLYGWRCSSPRSWSCWATTLPPVPFVARCSALVALLALETAIVVAPAASGGPVRALVLLSLQAAAERAAERAAEHAPAAEHTAAEAPPTAPARPRCSCTT